MSGQILDIAVGELVRVRNGEIAKVVGRSGHDLLIAVTAYNGFGHVLWREPAYPVSMIDGSFGRFPDKRDIVAKVTKRDGWWSWKATNAPFTYRNTTTDIKEV